MDIPLITIYEDVVPNRGQPGSIFAPASDSWLAYQNVYIPEMNISIGVLNTTFAEVDLLAQSTNALAATVVSAADFKGEWGNLAGTLDLPATVFRSGTKWQLLNDLADVTASEPTNVNVDWTFASQTSDRATITTPYTLTIPGRYFIIGGGLITIPNPNTLSDGQEWDFKREIGQEPTIQVSVALDVFKFEDVPDDDGIIMDEAQSTFTIRNGFYEV